MDFEKALIEAVKMVRHELQACDTITTFALSIHASGRVHDGDVRISFTLSTAAATAEGNSLHRVVQETLRRHNWDERNAPLCIGYDGGVAPTSAPEEPF